MSNYMINKLDLVIRTNCTQASNRFLSNVNIILIHLFVIICVIIIHTNSRIYNHRVGAAIELDK